MQNQSLTYLSTPSRYRAYMIYAFGALGGILFGYDNGVIAGALLFIRKDMMLSPHLQGLMVGSLLFGAMIGAFTTGQLADRLGQRKLLMYAGLAFFVTSLAASAAPNAYVLIGVRVLIGMAAGTASVQVPLYLVEIAPKHLRGGLASLNQLSIASGIFLSYLVCYLLAADGQWRWMLGLAAVPSILLTLGMLVQPESPRWLVRKGRVNEALSVLLMTNTPVQAAEALKQIQQTSAHASAKFSTVLKSKALRRTLVSVFGLAVLQQALGINTVVYYAPTILRAAGFDNSAALLNSVGLGLLSIFMTIFAARVVDTVGRRPLLICGALVMGISMGALAWVFGAGSLTSVTGRVVAVGALALFKAAFSFSWGPLVWVLMPELLPMKVRAKVMGAAAMCTFLTNFVVASCFPTLLRAGAGFVFVMFACICVLASCFAAFVLRETAGLSLEEIERGSV
ncbi:sugar porter family MFS transporter [Paraburkholderia fungorum]|uniref:sugar porter family MFS transporter n=1 Tax=Paraburkholderia fungorum TaxID=134537 RepID=UPI0038BDE79B